MGMSRMDPRDYRFRPSGPAACGIRIRNRPAVVEGPFQTILTSVKLDDIGRRIKEG
jgi:hypothetical protein